MLTALYLFVLYRNLHTKFHVSSSTNMSVLCVHTDRQSEEWLNEEIQHKSIVTFCALLASAFAQS